MSTEDAITTTAADFHRNNAMHQDIYNDRVPDRYAEFGKAY
jgi:hypothetical protein